MSWLSDTTGINVDSGGGGADLGGGLAGSIVGSVFGGGWGSIGLGLKGLMGDRGAQARGFQNEEAERQYKALREKQANEAKQFRLNLPTYLSQLGENQDQVIRGKLTEDLYTNVANANKRGLLGSGLERGKSLNRVAQAGAESAQQRAQLDRDLKAQADAYDEAYIMAGNEAYKQDLNKADAAYKEALSRRQSENAGVKSLLGAGGSLLGGYMGAKG